MEAWHRWIQKDLKELWDWFVDAWTDAAATLVPFVPAWGSKVVRKANDVIDQSEKINTALFKIRKNQINGTTIIKPSDIRDPKYSWKNWEWVKKAFYDKDLKTDFHWMEKVWWKWKAKIWTRDQIKAK